MPMGTIQEIPLEETLMNMASNQNLGDVEIKKEEQKKSTAFFKSSKPELESGSDSDNSAEGVDSDDLDDEIINPVQ